MLETTRQLMGNQFEAVLCTIHECIERCPEDVWDAPVINLRYCQVVFHTLFFTDFYLEKTDQSIRDQPFHKANSDIFRDYEELEDKKQELMYDKPSMRLYLQHCREKAAVVIASETAESLSARCGFPRRNCTQAELHVHNIRHVVHHAAQLSMCLRNETGQGVPWIDHGWKTEL